MGSPAENNLCAKHAIQGASTVTPCAPPKGGWLGAGEGKDGKRRGAR
ncbi:MAG: hypothetical protein IKW86_03260 [Salinivirgaceae bacterium]|nr:hypothetical protein [Salinivirgaceae bacterium]